MHFQLRKKKKKVLNVVKSSLFYATICPSKLTHIEGSNRVLRPGESNPALSKDALKLDFARSGGWQHNFVSVSFLSSHNPAVAHFSSPITLKA